MLGMVKRRGRCDLEGSSSDAGADLSAHIGRLVVASRSGCNAMREATLSVSANATDAVISVDTATGRLNLFPLC